MRRHHHLGYVCLVLAFASVAGCSSCKKGKDAADAAPEAAAMMPSASASEMASAAPSASEAPSAVASEDPGETAPAAPAGKGTLPTGIPPKCRDIKGGTSSLGSFTIVPTGGGGVSIHGKEANASCSPTDAKHLRCKWVMLPGTKNSNLKTPAVTKGWTLTIKEASAPSRYFYGSSYFGGDFDCHEIP